MKTWTIPVATEQQFAANDYVSACAPMELKCDLCLDNTGKYSPNKVYDRVHIEGTMVGGQYDGQTFHKAYQACGAVCEVPFSDVSRGTVTHYANDTDKAGGELCTTGRAHWLIPMESPVEIYYWVTDGDNGHATIAVEPNKS